jgi:hypothetical protein
MTYAILRFDPEAPTPVQCDGPTASGCCPRPESDGRVACAGQDLLFALEGLRPFRLRVEPSATTCPLAAFGVCSAPRVDHMPERRVQR